MGLFTRIDLDSVLQLYDSYQGKSKSYLEAVLCWVLFRTSIVDTYMDIKLRNYMSAVQ